MRDGRANLVSRFTLSTNSTFCFQLCLEKQSSSRESGAHTAHGGILRRAEIYPILRYSGNALLLLYPAQQIHVFLTMFSDFHAHFLDLVSSFFILYLFFSFFRDILYLLHKLNIRI